MLGDTGCIRHLNSGEPLCFSLAFHSVVTLRMSWYAPPDTVGIRFVTRVYLKTPNAPGQRTFSRCAAPFFLEIRQYSCEKMSCSAQKFLAAGHIESFQIHPSCRRISAINRRCRPDLLVCIFLRGSLLCLPRPYKRQRPPMASPHRGRLFCCGLMRAGNFCPGSFLSRKNRV